MSQIEENKTKFLNILGYCGRPGMDKMIAMLERTDFFTAPASQKNYGSMEGGLLDHSLKVYSYLLDHISYKAFDLGFPIFDEVKKAKEGLPLLSYETAGMVAEREKLDIAIKKVFGDKVGLDSLIICGLLHDCNKINYYEAYDKSVYKGTDNYGKKVWESERAYKKREEGIFVLGDSGSNSNYIINSCMRLTYDEMLAIENYKGMTDNGYPQPSAPMAWSKSLLALYLHMADLEAVYSGD